MLSPGLWPEIDESSFGNGLLSTGTVNGMLIDWLILVFGGFCEAGWAFCLNQAKVAPTHGKLWIAGFAALYVLSALCLAKAVRAIPTGTAYAIWTGIGAFSTITLGIILFHEPATVARLACMLMIFGGVVGLKFVS